MTFDSAMKSWWWLTEIHFVDRRPEGEGSVAVEGVQYLVFDLADGIAIEDAALDLLLEFFRRQRNSLWGCKHTQRVNIRLNQSQSSIQSQSSSEFQAPTYVIRLVRDLLVVVLLNQMDRLHGQRENR